MGCGPESVDEHVAMESLELTSAYAPGARMGAALAMHESLYEMVLFGGEGPPALDVTDDTTPKYLADTWTYDGAQWQVVASAVPARTDHAMAYADNRAVVLFGGMNESVLGDT